MLLKFDAKIYLDDYPFAILLYSMFSNMVLFEYFDRQFLYIDGVIIDMCSIWMSFNRYLCAFYLIANCIGIEFHIRIAVDKVMLKKKVRTIMEDFIDKTKLDFVGKVPFYAGNFRGLLHPYDFFIGQLMTKFCNEAKVKAELTYIRTNPTLPLKLIQAEKFAVDYVLHDHIVDSMHSTLGKLYHQVISMPDFAAFAEEIRFSIAGDFDSLLIDNSSAAGFPFKSGVKRGKVKTTAIDAARVMLKSDDEFNAYMNKHVWYTSGRAKLQKPGDDPSARLISYSGFSSMLISMLFFQPFHKIMERFDWCSVGMSWMNGGTRKFAEMFDDEEGVAPYGYEYCSLDISGWDNSMSASLLTMIQNFYVKIMNHIGVDDGYIWRFCVIFQDMIHGKITFPGGYCFRTTSGMKSGFADTSHGDTLGHELVFQYLSSRFGVKMKHALYGDDNFFLKPIGLSNDDIIDAYAECGFKVKYIRSSKYLHKVDYLSKTISYQNGEYFIYRDSVETFSRLLMPEEGNPTQRDIPDEVIAAERLIGHLLDNPFNPEVRNAIYSMLAYLRDHYQIYSVEFSNRMRKQYMFKPNDIARISSIPIIPSLSFIKELYGVMEIPLIIRWPNLKFDIDVLNFERQDLNMNYFQDSCAYYRSVKKSAYFLGASNRISAITNTSPYRSPKVVFGYHAGRLAYAIKKFNIDFESVVDFGTHPGACAELLLRKAKSVIGVSLIPDVDKDKRFPRICPYVLKDERFTFVDMDANDYKIDGRVDLLHDDVDPIFVTRDEKFDIHQSLMSLKRLRDNCNNVRQAITTIHDVNKDVVEALYSTYRAYGSFSMVKPHYSNPWKPEFIVLFRYSKEPLMKSSLFKQSCYYYFNSYASDIVSWSNALKYNVEKISSGEEPVKCFFQDDEAFQNGVKSQLFVGVQSN